MCTAASSGFSGQNAGQSRHRCSGTLPPHLPVCPFRDFTPPKLRFAATRCPPALLVFDDADVDKAVEWAMFGVFWTCGQICSSTSRLLVQEGVAPTFFARLKKRTESIKARWGWAGGPLGVGCAGGCCLPFLVNEWRSSSHLQVNSLPPATCRAATRWPPTAAWGPWCPRGSSPRCACTGGAHWASHWVSRPGLPAPAPASSHAPPLTSSAATLVLHTHTPTHHTTPCAALRSWPTLRPARPRAPRC